MTGHSSWRSLRSVMVVTVHVAAVAYVIRSLAFPSTLVGSLIWVPATVSVAVFVSWPIGRVIASAFDPGERPDATCPRCNRGDLRPLIRPGAGLFQPITSYRCALCRTTFREDGGSRIEEPASPGVVTIDPSGIAYLSDPLEDGEIQFLDDHPGSSHQSK